MDKLKITIVTVCLNSKDTIEATILSVLSQTYDNIEYLIQDGGSTDGTIEVISKYKQVNLYVEKDYGIYDAMNKAKQRASGDFLLFLGADDILYSENIISSFVKHVESSATIYYGNVLRVNSGHIYDGEFSKWKWGYENICHQSIFYPKQIYQYYDYDINYKLVADWVYNLKLLSLDIRFKYINLIVSCYNDISGISSTSVDKLFISKQRLLIINAVGILPYVWGLIVKIKKRIK